jgi:hypothetical protein
MNFLHKNLEFTTVEEGEKQLADAEKIRDSMGGALYYSILTDDVEEIKSKLQQLKISECFNDPNGNYTK